jgi:hypothetical protein
VRNGGPQPGRNSPDVRCSAMHLQLKVTLRGVSPPIWRRVLVLAELTLFDLHRVIQIAMGWEDYHLHDFTIDRKRYAVPDREDFDNPIDERETRLHDVLRARQKFTYQYDFGDGWQHGVLVEKAVDDATIRDVSCVDGARACPPEDSGGPWAYEEKLKALAAPNDPRTRELRDWIGQDFDPTLFNCDAVNEELHRAFARPSPRRRTPGH